MTLGVALLVLFGAWALALGWTSLDVERLGQVGDTVAPIVGILSLLAVLAALDSVRLQASALGLQRIAHDEQRSALHAELQLQREAVKLQAEALKDQQHALQVDLTAQRHAAMGAAYAMLFGAVEAYGAEVRGYLDWVMKNSADKRIRAEKQAPVDAKYEPVRSARWGAHFVDPSLEREALRDAVCTRYALEPQGADTPDTQRAHARNLYEDLDALTPLKKKLRTNLLAEMGFNPEPRANLTGGSSA